VATSDRLPSHPTKDGRATDSCFALIGAHQCGVLMVWGGDHWLPQIGLRAPLAMVSVLLTWSGGIISSDSICHKFLTLGNVYKFPFAH